MTRHGTTNRAVFSLLLCGLLPSFAVGQTVRTATADAPKSIAELRAQAEALYDDPARWGEAGAILESAARLTAVEDPEGRELLVRAARLQAYAGELARARANLKEAGWCALGQGEVLTAADAYVAAAIVAVEQGDRAGAKDLVRVVRQLSEWPGITPGQRRHILARIG